MLNKIAISLFVNLLTGWLVLSVQGQWTTETIDRGLIALVQENGDVYLGWRLLQSDAEGIGFDLYRQTEGGPEVKLNNKPLVETCDFVDTAVNLNRANRWRLSIHSEGTHSGDATVSLAAHSPARPYVAIPFQGDYVCNRVGIADLNGDGRYDYVIKQPRQITDPGVWNKSEATWKIEAYLHDGTFLWRKDLGWNIEQGVWYSPMIVHDFDGDGRAEVAVKTSVTDVDYRNPDGHPLAGKVTTGPEYCSLLDGMTGRELDRVDWIARGELEDWGDSKNNRAARHLMGVAYLDGKHPALLVLRGTYTLMRVDAYVMKNGKLASLWKWSGDNEDPPVRGQGMHGMLAADVTGDGCDEIILGSAVLKGDSSLLWNVGLGHPDACYVADILPERPGLEILYGIEPKRNSNAICLVEARTGKMIWGCDFATQHAHSAGMFADFIADNPGMEFYIGEKDKTAFWIHSADGRLLTEENLGNLNPKALYWESGGVKPYAISGRIQQYHGKTVGGYQGDILAVADILGDWREELITTVPGELRIYSTTIPAQDRRVTLMQDPVYRSYVAMVSMGYLYPPQLSYYLEIAKSK